MPRGTEGLRKIVVGIDGSDSSLQALAWAARLCRLSGATLTTVMAWSVPNAWGRTPTWPPGMDPAEETRKQLAHAVESVLGAHDAPTVHEVVVEGHPASVLIDAGSDADLLVVGRRGRTEVLGMSFGSVSQHCASHAPCPVVVVGPDHGDGS